MRKKVKIELMKLAVVIIYGILIGSIVGFIGTTSKWNIHLGLLVVFIISVTSWAICKIFSKFIKKILRR